MVEHGLRSRALKYDSPSILDRCIGGDLFIRLRERILREDVDKQKLVCLDRGDLWGIALEEPVLGKFTTQAPLVYSDPLGRLE